MKLYTAPALAKAAGVSLRQVQYWTNLGHLKPLEVEGLPTRGTGNRRVYEQREVDVAKRMGQFYDLDQIARLVRAAVDGRPASLHGLTLMKTPTAPPAPTESEEATR